jgi:YVTN family beta-propeller protein
MRTLSRGLSRLSRRQAYAITGGAAAVVLAAAAVTTMAGGHTAGHADSPAGSRNLAASHQSARHVRLISSSCSGPAGAAYVSDAGWDGFSAIDTATCKVIQTYNVGDTPVPGDAGDYNYSSTNEGLAIHGTTLYFADTGNSTVAVIDASKLDPSNYNPAEKLINVGLFPQALAVTPNGKQVWVADTGPQTSSSSPADIKVISTATNKITATLRVSGSPSQIAFTSTRAYVVTSQGLSVYDTATGRQVGQVRGLGDPRGEALSPNGKTVYVTNTRDSELAAISTASDRVTGTTKVGQEPWQVVVSPDGKTVYVTNPDSDTVSVISAATGHVSHTISITGGPAVLGLTPNGKQLWVGDITSAYVTVVNTAGDTVVGSINLGGSTANSGDGYGPNGIALTATPTPGS